MKFWDSSALIPLCLTEPHSGGMQALLRQDAAIVAWWASPVECWSAVARTEREGRLKATEADAARRVLGRLRDAWMEVLPTEPVREHAVRLLRLHALRAADALQLAAALVWAGSPPKDADVVTLDERLADVARLEGFSVLPAPAL